MRSFYNKKLNKHAAAKWEPYALSIKKLQASKSRYSVPLTAT